MPLPDWTQMSRHRVLRAPTNPLDRSTIVSIYPKRIEETKHTLFPGLFIIEPGTYTNPSVLIVEPSSWWKDVSMGDERVPPLEIPVASIRVADSVIKDYCSGLLGCEMGSVMPGLFMVPGAFTVAEIQKNNKNLVDAANLKQRAWFQVLVNMADVLWARTNGNPLCIADDMRLAARELEYKDKPWMQNYQHMELKNCPACGTLRNSNFPICANCKTILDPAAYAKLGLKQAV